MSKSFPEIEKEQFNARVPVDLVAKVRARAEYKGWSISRAVTEAMSLGMGIDPSDYGIQTHDAKQTA